MGEKIVRSLKYLPAMNRPDDLISVAGKLQEGDSLLLGEYGSLLPLAFSESLKKVPCDKKFFEIIARNRNRDLIKSAILSTHSCGLDGIVIASGAFRKSEDMAKPVYDLDPTQTLRMVLELQMEQKLPADFLIGMRAPVGSEAAHARSRYFLQNGADFLVIQEGEAFAELAKKTVTIQEL